MKQKTTTIITIMMLLMSVSLVSATEVDIDFDVGAGEVDIDVDNTEAGVNFHGIGSWTGNLNSADTGNYLDTNVLVESTTGGRFDFSGSQYLSGYTTDKIEFAAFSVGDTASMNTRFDNSNYVVQLERVDNSKDFLTASGSAYGAGWQMEVVNSADIASAGVSAQITGNGSAVFDTNQWHSTSIGSYGWGNPNSVNAPSYPGYYTPLNVVSAVGAGQFVQSAFGDNSLEFNGFTAGAGNAQFVANFAGGFNGDYSFHVK